MKVLMQMKAPFSASSSLLRGKGRLSPYLFTLIAFILFVAILYGQDFMCIFDEQLQNYSYSDKLSSTTREFFSIFFHFLSSFYKFIVHRILDRFFLFFGVCLMFKSLGMFSEKVRMELFS